jgi:hypothetical protein
MNSYDLRLDIPLRAVINVNLLSLVSQGGTLWDAKKELFCRDYPELDPYQPWKVPDQSLLISLLFCTIVVPREILDFPPNHSVYRDLDKAGVVSLFASMEPRNADSCQLVRCLRNSVAHALFSVEESGTEIVFDFWTDRSPIFRAKIEHLRLVEFLNIVGKRLSNEMLKLKTKQLGSP